MQRKNKEIIIRKMNLFLTFAAIWRVTIITQFTPITSSSSNGRFTLAFSCVQITLFAFRSKSTIAFFTSLTSFEVPSVWLCIWMNKKYSWTNNSIRDSKSIEKFNVSIDENTIITANKKRFKAFWHIKTYWFEKNLLFFKLYLTLHNFNIGNMSFVNLSLKSTNFLFSKDARKQRKNSRFAKKKYIKDHYYITKPFVLRHCLTLHLSQRSPSIFALHLHCPLVLSQGVTSDPQSLHLQSWQSFKSSASP